MASAYVGNWGVSMTTAPSDVTTKPGSHPRVPASTYTFGVSCPSGRGRPSLFFIVERLPVVDRVRLACCAALEHHAPHGEDRGRSICGWVVSTRSIPGLACCRRAGCVVMALCSFLVLRATREGAEDFFFVFVRFFG